MTSREYERDLLSRILGAMQRHGLSQCADSVFLAGSFGRDEATYQQVGDQVILQSDVEIGVVYRSKAAAKRMIAAVAAELPEELSCMPLSRRRMLRLDNFNHAILPSRHKTLLMYDLVAGHRHLWGRDYLADARIELSQVDRYEAKRLVANRIGELVVTEQNDPHDAVRWQAKLVAAIGSAYLLCTGGYACSYRTQAAQLAAQAAQADRIVGDGFSECYRAAFSFLREGGSEFCVAEEVLRGYVRGICVLFSDLAAPKVNTLSRKLKYLLKYLKYQKDLHIFSIETRTLDALLDGFVQKSPTLPSTAALWYAVLY